MRISAAIGIATLVVGSVAAGCPYAGRAKNPVAGCPYSKRAPVVTSAEDAPALSRRGPIEGKKGIFYSESQQPSRRGAYIIDDVLMLDSEPDWTFGIHAIHCQRRW